MIDTLLALYDALTVPGDYYSAFGFLAALPMIASGLGALFGKGSQKSAEGRMQEAQFLQQQDALRNQQFNTRQGAEMQQANLDLQRKNFEENSRGGRAKQALIGSLLGNMKDVNVNVPGIQTASVTGGLRPSALGQGGQNAAALLQQMAMEKMQTPETYQGGNLLSAPALSGIPKASGWEKTAGILGILGTLGGGLGQLWQDNNQSKYTGLPGTMN